MQGKVQGGDIQWGPQRGISTSFSHLQDTAAKEANKADTIKKESVVDQQLLTLHTLIERLQVLSERV